MVMQIPEKVEYIINVLMKNGYEAYAVGGCVRDSILGRVPEDWDITTSAQPEQVKALFHRTIDTGIQHGTVTVMMDKEGFEVTTYRIDGEYEDSRHPKNIEFTSNLEEDLKRRDFTINAMAYNPKDGLVDIFGGIEDINKKIIRCVGNANDRFSEDALRILRAVRFAGQLGFAIEEQTKEAIIALAPTLKNISAERIRVELDKLLMGKHPELIRVASETGICKVVLPELDSMLAREQNNPHHIYNVGEHCIKAVMLLNEEYKNSPEYDKKTHSILAWTMLLHDVGKPECYTEDENGIGHFYGHGEKGTAMAKKILKRLRFDNYTTDTVSRLVCWHDYSFGTKEASMRKAANKIGTDIMELLFMVHRLDILAQNPDTHEVKLKKLEEAKALYESIRAKQHCLTLKELAVNGRDLMEAGFAKGKQLGDILEYLLGEVLEEPELNEKEKLLELASARFAKEEGKLPRNDSNNLCMAELLQK